MRKHFTSHPSDVDIGRGHHRTYRLSLAETTKHKDEIARAERAFLTYVKGGGRGTVDVTTYSVLGVT